MLAEIHDDILVREAKRWHDGPGQPTWPSPKGGPVTSRAKRLPFVTVLIVLVGLVAGCASSPRGKARSRAMLQVSLKTAAEDFWEGLRWERFDEIGVHALDRGAWLKVSDELLDSQGSFRITDYTIIGADVVISEDNGPSEALVVVRYELTTLPTMSLERRSWEQDWIRVAGQWRLIVEGNEAAMFLAKPPE